MTVREPEPAQRGSQAQQSIVVAAPVKPLQGDPEVPLLDLQAPQYLLAARSERRKAASLRQAQAPARVRATGQIVLAAVNKLLQLELPDGLQHREARLALPWLLTDQAPVHQRC